MEERFTPQMFIEYYISARQISVADLGVAPVVVLTWGRATFQSLVESVGAQVAAHWIYGERNPLCSGHVNGHAVSIVHPPVGAPGTVMLMEELIACGARVFLGLGWAGSLQPSASVGSFIIPTACIREEGTSFHYLDSTASIGGSIPLAERLRATSEAQDAIVRCGMVWTTDAPYRETASKIETYQSQGVLGVDMETSAMYALGQVRGVKVCNLLVVSDELWQEWHPAFGSEQLRIATKRAEQVILQVLAEDLALVCV